MQYYTLHEYSPGGGVSVDSDPQVFMHKAEAITEYVFLVTKINDKVDQSTLREDVSAALVDAGEVIFMAQPDLFVSLKVQSRAEVS
jgi:hypothetical protein